MNLEEINRKIETKTPFAFSRWGDGEWLNIRKSPGKNCDGNFYYHDLGDELKKIVEVRQDYYLGAQDYKRFKLLSDVEKFPNQDWIDADVFHKASMENQLDSFIDVLQVANVVYIGNETHRNLNFINKFIEIPYANVWKHKDRLLELLISSMDKNNKVYLFSAGMATNVFIHEMWDANKKNTLIDVGSVFDPYVGRRTRSYHHKLKI